jgi:hypothetical protein
MEWNQQVWKYLSLSFMLRYSDFLVGMQEPEMIITGCFWSNIKKLKQIRKQPRKKHIFILIISPVLQY